MKFSKIAAACLLVLAASASAVQLPKPQTPMSQNDNPYYAEQSSALSGGVAGAAPSNRYGTSDLPEDSPLFVPPADMSSPDQVKLTTVSPTEIWVTFSTGEATNGTYMLTGSPPSRPDVPSKPTFVSYGLSSASYTTKVPSMSGMNYQQTAVNGTEGVYYTSPFLWVVKLTKLKPNTRYFYRVYNTNNSPKAAPSAEYNFKTAPAVGDVDTPIKIGIFGDIGETYNSSDTVQHLIKNKPEMILNMGDFTYADHYLNNNGNKWDFWGRLLSPLLAFAPHNPTNGNHEIEAVNGNNQGRTQVAYNARYPMPATKSGSSNNLYYSINFGSVHIAFLSQYIDFSTTSDQYHWFKKDLAAINRTATPWVFVIFHGPVYHTYTTHYKQYDCWRQIYEPLLNAAGVDLVMSGHVHAYERSNPVKNYVADATGCAPTYMTIGDGGNSERLYHAFVDGNATDGTPTGTDGCPAPDKDALSVSGDANVCIPAPAVAIALGQPYCTPTQPKWSAYREDAFGHAILDIISGTKAKLSWYRNMDSQMVITDTVKLQRDVSKCANRAQGAVLAAPLPADSTPTAAPAAAPAPKPTRHKPDVPATCTDSAQYRALGGCKNCMSYNSPFFRTVGGVKCVDSTTYSLTSVACSPLTVSVTVQTENGKSLKCIPSQSSTVNIVLSTKKTKRVPFLSGDVYIRDSLLLSNVPALRQRGEVIYKRLDYGRVLVQFNDSARDIRNQKGEKIKLTGALMYGDRRLNQCFHAAVTVC